MDELPVSMNSNMNMNTTRRKVYQLIATIICNHNLKHKITFNIFELDFGQSLLSKSCVVYDQSLLFISDSKIHKCVLRFRVAFPICSCDSIKLQNSKSNINLILDGAIVNVFSRYHRNLNVHKFNIDSGTEPWECQELCSIETNFHCFER
jgi:hypothetical protein